MNVILYLLGASLLLGGGALAIFLWSLRSGQYDDMEGAANRILFDDDESSPGHNRGAAARTYTNGEQ
jgi:cbb3-type cytochrome oxidase maturation protein